MLGKDMLGEEIREREKEKNNKHRNGDEGKKRTTGQEREGKEGK